MKKVYYNKLIRDKIPEVIRANGSDCEVKILSDDDFVNELLKKVEEEARELSECQNRKEIIEELSDVIDVIEEVKKVKNISEEEINEAKIKSMERKGGFDKKLFLVWSSNDGYKKNN